MSNEQKHTPTPWTIDDVLNNLDEDYDGQDIIISREGCPLVTVRGTDDMSCMDDDETEKMMVEVVANAEFVVSAVNSYETMQQRIKELEDFVAYTYGYTLNTSNKALFEKAEALLQSSKQL